MLNLLMREFHDRKESRSWLDKACHAQCVTNVTPEQGHRTDGTRQGSLCGPGPLRLRHAMQVRKQANLQLAREVGGGTGASPSRGSTVGTGGVASHEVDANL